jgi:hypothetical protein
VLLVPLVLLVVRVALVEHLLLGHMPPQLEV